MSKRITAKDLATMFPSVCQAAEEAGVTEANRWHLETGSKTYGRAYRIWLQSKDETKTGHYTPGVYEYLGTTATEAYRTLRAMRDAFHAVTWAREQGERDV